MQTDHYDRIFEIIYSEKDEVMWKKILYGLVSSEQMDPWDIDVGHLAKRYIDKIRELKQHDFRISGKVLLTAAILLKIKSDKLVGEDFEELDRLLASIEAAEDELASYHDANIPRFNEEIPSLIPKTPQPRKRKVSIFDLVKALQQALDVKKRRVWNSEPPKDIIIPARPREITEIIKEIYGKIKAFFMEGKTNLTFSKLLPSESKDDKLTTFVPLLHLSQQDKIELEQKEPFGEIDIMLKAKV